MLFCREYSKIHLYNQFKIEHVFQTKAAIKIFEDCDVEPMLFVFKHSNLIGHYRYSLLKYMLKSFAVYEVYLQYAIVVQRVVKVYCPQI